MHTVDESLDSRHTVIRGSALILAATQTKCTTHIAEFDRLQSLKPVAWLTPRSAALSGVCMHAHGSQQQCHTVLSWLVQQEVCSPPVGSGPQMPSQSAQLCPPQPAATSLPSSTRSAMPGLGQDVASSNGMQILLDPEEALDPCALQEEARGFARVKLAEPAFINRSLWECAPRHHLRAGTPLYATCRLPQSSLALLVYGTNPDTVHLVRSSSMLAVIPPVQEALPC